MGHMDERVEIQPIVEAIAPVGERLTVAPSETVPVVVHSGGQRKIVRMRWGLIPPRTPPGGPLRARINARDDRLLTSRMWYPLLLRSRCLIPADGFYEWSGPPGDRQPYHFRLATGGVFAFAGLYNTWVGPDGPVTSCAIITTDPNEVVEPIHDRMPAILHPDDEARWLDPGNQVPGRLLNMLRPYPADEMVAVPADPEPAYSSSRDRRPEAAQQPAPVATQGVLSL